MTICLDLLARGTQPVLALGNHTIPYIFTDSAISRLPLPFASGSDQLKSVHLRGFEMENLMRRYAVALALLSASIRAQQLSGAQMYMGYPGLSTSCEQALNTSVSCPIFLSPLSAKSVTPGSFSISVLRSKEILSFLTTIANTHNSGATLDTEEVDALCVDSCYTSLESARTSIQQACTASTDVIEFDNIGYPGNSFSPEVRLELC